jgi:hypothetical protein
MMQMMNKVVILVWLVCICVPLTGARYDLSMEQSREILSKDLVIGGTLDQSDQYLEIDQILSRFFLESLSDEQRNQLLYPATAGMVSAMYQRSFFELLPVEQLRLGIPIERENGYDVPFRVFYSQEGRQTSSTGSVYLRGHEELWKVAHVTVNFSNEQY